MEQYVYRNHKKLRCGWTTGSCAAAAAGAAVQLLLTGEAPGIYDLMTPAGVLLHLPVEEAKCAGSTASCAVRKNGGDDIDVTDGLLVFAQAEKTDGEASAVEIAAGGGIGRVTKPGLDQPPGSPAINAVPEEIDREIAARKLRYLGVGIDVLTEKQKAYIEECGERADLVHNKMVDPSEDNMLKITNDGKMCALDYRLVDGNAEDNPNSKVNIAVENIFRKYQESDSFKGTQVIFLDKSTPKKDEFNLYDDIKGKLVNMGIPSEEIAFIHDAKNDRGRLFNEYL